METKSDKYDELLKEFLSRTNATTARHYRSALVDFAKFAKARNFETAVRRLLGGTFTAANGIVVRYRADMEGTRDSKGTLKKGRGLSPNAVNLRLTVLRSLVKKARRQGLIDWELDVPNLPFENVHETTGPGMDLLNQMLEVAKSQPGIQGRRNYAILRLAGELGLRRKEMIGLNLEDFDPVARTVRIRGKGRREHEKLVCTEKTTDALTAWLQLRPKADDGRPFFTNAIPGRPARLSATALYEIVRRLGQAALPKGSRRKVRPHGIRHTAITEAIRRSKEAGLAREEVQKFSRHKDFRMVARYLDADEEAQRKLAAQLGSRLV